MTRPAVGEVWETNSGEIVHLTSEEGSFDFSYDPSDFVHPFYCHTIDGRSTRRVYPQDLKRLIGDASHCNAC